MRPEDVAAELVEAALATQVEPGLPILPEDAGTALNYIRDDLRRALAAVLPLYGASVLGEAADAWQRGEWANAPRRADRVQERIANGQYVGTWIRALAASQTTTTEEARRG